MLDQLLPIIMLFVGSFICTSLLIKVLIAPLSKFGMIDVPGARRAHKIATPRGGGLAISLIIMVIGPLVEYTVTKSFDYSAKVFLPFFLISLISFLDDVRAIPVLIRFVVHLMCTASVVYNFMYPSLLLHYDLPIPLILTLAVMGLTAYLNIYNFLDGIDGITAAQSIHLSATILLLCYLKSDVITHLKFIVVVATLICACSSSFIMFNWPPAKIFLGDVGSISLGFLIGLCLLIIAAGSERLFISATIASLYYIADGGLTILIRLLNREKIWQPHLKHFFQKAVKKGMSHKQVVKRVISCNFALMILSVSALYTPLVSLFLAMIIVAIILIKFSR